MKNKCLILLVLLLGSWLPALAQTEQKTAYCGQIVTLTPTPATGYHFVRWSDAQGVKLSENTAYSFTITGNTDIKAESASAGI